jgi:hypothetical protein
MRVPSIKTMDDTPIVDATHRAATMRGRCARRDSPRGSEGSLIGVTI